MNKSARGQPIKSGELLKDLIFTIPPSLINFRGTDEQIYCSHFGCGKILTLQEQLFGNKCIECKSKVKTDPVFFVSHPNKKSA